MLRRLETLAKIPLFDGLSAAEIGALDTQCSWRRAEAKEWVIKHGAEGTDVFFVVTGKLRVLIQSPSGSDIILGDIDSGEFFGELAAIDGKPRSAGIVCLTGSVIARMPPSVFREAVHRHPSVCDQLLHLLASRVRILANRVNELSSLEVRHRIYSELLRLSKPELSGSGRAIISPPPIHNEIAGRVSTRRETVARELKGLERAGLLQRRRGALVITDPRSLEQLIRQAFETLSTDTDAPRAAHPGRRRDSGPDARG